jgi:hypothetical protein
VIRPTPQQAGRDYDSELAARYGAGSPEQARGQAGRGEGALSALMKKLLTAVAVLLAVAAPALAADPMDGRLAAEVQRTSTWSNDVAYTPLVYDVAVPGARGFQRVELRGWWQHPEIIATWGAVAIPDDFRGSPGCDDYRDSATRTATKWWPYPLGVQASGARFLPGIVTAEDWANGNVDHEVDVVVPEACGTFRAPAVRTDGWGTPAENTACLEYGTRYKLPASTDCDPLGWWGGPGNAKATRLVCLAAKRYGLRITDRNLCCVTVRYENVLARTGVDPFGLSWDDRMLRWYFPWGKLRVAR